MRPTRSYDTILAEANAKAQKGKDAIKAEIQVGETAATKAIEEVHKKEKASIAEVNQLEAALAQEKMKVKDALKPLKSEEEKIKKTTKRVFGKDKPLSEKDSASLKVLETKIAALESQRQSIKAKEAEYKKQIEAIKDTAKQDIAKIKADLKALKARLKVDFYIILPALFEAIHLAIEAGKSLAAVASNPIDTFRAGSAGLKLVDLLKGEVGEVGKDKINQIITSETVKSLLADHDLWQVIGLHSSAIHGIVESRKDLIGKALKNELEEMLVGKKAGPVAAAGTSITNASRVHAAGIVFNNPDAVAAIIKITSEKQFQQSLVNLFAAPPVGSETLVAFCAAQGIDQKAIQSILPGILDMVKIIGPNNSVLVEILKVVGPTVADPTKPLDINAVLPHVGALLFGDNAIAPDIGTFLVKNKDALLKLGEIAISSQTNMVKLARYIKTNKTAILELVNAHAIDEKVLVRVAQHAHLDPLFLETMIVKFKSNKAAVDELGSDKSIAALESRIELTKRALVIGQDILPIIAKIMEKNKHPHFNKIIGVLPQLIAVYKPNPAISEVENKKAAAAFNAAKMPIILGLIPDFKELLFSQDKGIAADIANMLEKDHTILVQMAKFAEALQPGSAKFLVLMEDILPIASKVMKHPDALGKIMDAIPGLMEVYSPNPEISEEENKKAAAAFNAAKLPIVMKLIPDLRGMLFAKDKGIAGNLATMLTTKKDVLLELGKTAKENQEKTLAFAKLLKAHPELIPQPNVPQAALEQAKLATLANEAKISPQELLVFIKQLSTNPEKMSKLAQDASIAALESQVKTTDMLLGMGDSLLPLLSKNILPIVDKVMQNDALISQVTTILPTVMASGKPDPAALKELMKPVKELLFSKGIVSDLLAILDSERPAIVRMAGVAEAYQTGATKFALLLEDILPIVSKVMKNQDAIGKIMDALPELMAVYQPNKELDEASNKAAAASFNAVKTQKIAEIFPDLKKLLLGEQGVIKDIAKFLGSKKDVLLEMGNTVKVNQLKKRATLTDEKEIAALDAQIKTTDMMLGMAGTLLPLVANNLLPVVEKVMAQHDSEITQIMAALPAVIATGKPDALTLQGLIAPVKQLLFGNQGITDELVNGIEGNKAALVDLVTTNPGVQKVLQSAFAPPKKAGEVAAAPVNVNLPKPLVTNALTLATTFLKNNKAAFGNILDIVQNAKINKKGKFEISNMQLGDIAWELRKTMRDEEIIKGLKDFLTTENIQFLGKLPQLEKFNLGANAAFIQDVGKQAINILPMASKFIQNNFDIIQKMLQEQDNLANGVFKDTSITPDELVKIAQTGLATLIQFDLNGLLSAHKEEAKSLVQSVVANALVGVEKPDLVAKIVVDSAAILLKPDVLTSLLDKVGNIAQIIDDKTPAKEKLDKVFEITDIFAKQLKSKELKDLYKEAALPLIEANKTKIAEFITKEARNSKVNIDGNKVVGIIKNPKTLETLMEAYEAYKQHSTLKAMGKGVKAFFQSKDLRSIVYRIVVDKIKDRTYPNFIRRWTVGSKINKIIHEAKPKSEILPEEQDKAKAKVPEKIDLAAKLAEKSTGLVGIYNSTLNTRTCKGLDFGQLKFDNFEIKGFNFKEASFGSKKEGVNFSGSNISKTNFEGCTLRGKKIDLTGTTLDFQSFKSILPILDKAARNKKTEIIVKDMKIDVSKCSVKEMEEFEKMKNSRFGKKFLKEDSDIKLLTTKEHDVKDVKVEKTKAEAVTAAKGKGNPPSL